MKMKFTHALHIDGHTFSISGVTKGVHDVPERVLKHPHFAKYVKIGWIVDPAQSVEVSAETLDQRQARLAQKIADGIKKPVASAEPVAPASDEPAVEETAAEEVEEHKDSKKRRR